MKTLYGSISTCQIEEIKEILHKDIFKLLCLKEEKYKDLDLYFKSVLWKINGFASFLCSDRSLLEIISLLESARLESKKTNYDHYMYRKSILDSMTLVNKIGE